MDRNQANMTEENRSAMTNPNSLPRHDTSSTSTSSAFIPSSNTPEEGGPFTAPSGRRESDAEESIISNGSNSGGGTSSGQYIRLPDPIPSSSHHPHRHLISERASLSETQGEAPRGREYGYPDFHSYPYIPRGGWRYPSQSPFSEAYPYESPYPGYPPPDPYFYRRAASSAPTANPYSFPFEPPRLSPPVSASYPLPHMMSWPHEPYSDWQGDIPRPAPPPVAPSSTAPAQPPQPSPLSPQDIWNHWRSMDPRPRTWDPRSRPPPPFHPSEPLRREDMDASTHPSLQRYWSHYPYDERFQPFPPYAYPYRHPYAAPSYWPPGVRPPSSHRSEGSFDDRSKDDDDHSLHRRHLSDGSLVPEKPDTVTTPAPDASSSTAEPIPDEPLITVPGSSKTSRRRVKPQDTPQVHVSSKPLKRKISPKIEAAIAAEPSLSPQDPQPPHSRTRFRKMTEVDVRCSSSNCGARNMALCILHGTPTTPTSTTATCAQCLGAQQSDDETLKRKRSEGTKKRRVARRKESDEEDDIAEGSNDGQMRSCSLCKGVVGEIRFNMEGGGEGDFQVETICSKCRHKYSFCTECGGGGRYRTGKWRPQELFSFGRRTCSLSHIRIGTAPLDFEVFALPNERNAIGRDAASLETFLAECKEVFEDCLYATAAVPEMMEKPNSTSLTFTDVEAKVLQEFTLFSTSIRTEFSLPASTTSPTSPNSPRRYLATSCIPQTRRKRGRIVAADDDDQPVKSSSNRTLVACAMAEYAPSIGLLTIKNLTIRVPTLQQGAIDGELICAFLDRVEKDDADIDITHAAVALTSIITPQASPGALRTKLRRPLCVGIRVPVQYPKWITQLARLGFAEREVFEGKVEGKAEGVDGESVTEVFATFEEVRIATLSKIHKKAVSASRLKKSALKD